MSQLCYKKEMLDLLKEVSEEELDQILGTGERSFISFSYKCNPLINYFCK